MFFISNRKTRKSDIMLLSDYVCAVSVAKNRLHLVFFRCILLRFASIIIKLAVCVVAFSHFFAAVFVIFVIVIVVVTEKKPHKNENAKMNTRHKHTEKEYFYLVFFSTVSLR